jgi:SAM-dependent methyltransferase
MRGVKLVNVQEYNSKAWDKVADGGSEWSKPVSSEQIERARNGDFSIILTPLKSVPRDWFPETLEKTNVLCLASGGGQQVPILAAAGANVTSFDNSRRQLEIDQETADREGLSIVTEQGDAADLSRFADESFDMIWNPCSNCFMPELSPVWRESYRVLKKGGALLAGFHNSFLFVFDRVKDEKEGVLQVKYSLPYSDLGSLSKEELDQYIKDGEAMEYGHTLDSQIGGQIDAGFVIAGFFEDYWSDAATTLNKYAPTFIATKALKL